VSGTAIKFQVAVFWVLTPCVDVVGYQSFGGPCCFQIQLKKLFMGSLSQRLNSGITPKYL